MGSSILGITITLLRKRHRRRLHPTKKSCIDTKTIYYRYQYMYMHTAPNILFNVAAKTTPMSTADIAVDNGASPVFPLKQRSRNILIRSYLLALF